jgi:hypothetical protein
MKHNLLGTVCFVGLLLGVAAVAPTQARHDRPWSSVCLQGEWGYTETGIVVLPTNPPTVVNAVAVGKYTFDASGNFTGTQYSNSSISGKNSVLDMKIGTYVMNSDFTGQIILDVYDPSNVHLRHSVWDIVVADNGNEIRGIMESMVMYPSGASVSPVITMTATRLFPSRGENWLRALDKK